MSKNDSIRDMLDKIRDDLSEQFDELFQASEEDDDDDDIDFDDIDFDNIIVLNDEAGNNVRFEFLDLIEYEGNDYVVLLPVDDDEDSGEVVILQVVSDDDSDEESYLSVESEKTLAAVFEIFKEKFKDEFNFED